MRLIAQTGHRLIDKPIYFGLSGFLGFTAGTILLSNYALTCC